MSPHFNERIFPAIFEAHVGNVRAQVDHALREAARAGRELNVEHLEKIFIGINKESLKPDLISRLSFLEHALIVGHPGSGKTARLAALIAQLIRSQSCSVVVVDLKGEHTLFQGAREECHYNRMRFRWLTNRVGFPSYAYNPICQSHIPWLSMNQRVQPLLRSLGLTYGEVYGGAWFASVMETFLNNLMTYYNTSIYSFRDLATFCADPNLYLNAEKKLGTKEDWSSSRHAHNEIFRLAGVAACNVTRNSKGYSRDVFDNAIDVAQLFDRPQVVYLDLSSIGEDKTARNISKLMLYGLLEVGDLISSEKRRGVPVRSCPVFFVVDEFSALVSNTFLPVLALARSKGLGCIMCLQSLSQLALGDQDLTNPIISTTAYKQIFSAPDLFTKKYVSETSGEREELTASWEQEIPPYSRTIRPSSLGPQHALPNLTPFDRPKIRVHSTLRPESSVGDVAAISANKFDSLFHLVSDAGGTNYRGRWVPTWSGFHIDVETYKKREHEPFPGPEPGTFMVTPFSEYDLRYHTPAQSPPSAVPVPLPAPTGKKPALTVAQMLKMLQGGR